MPREKAKYISVGLSQTEYDKIKKVAKHFNISMTQLIRDMIKRNIKILEGEDNGL